MHFFKKLENMGHEQVVICSNPSQGLKAIIAIHNTTLGPALGGTRMWPYRSEEEALEDALRLSRGMTYKAAVTGLNFGGGKAVIIGDPKKDKSEGLFRALGAFIERMKGQFITGEDVGIDVNDIEYIFMETDYVVGLSREHGGSGDPSPMTAFGVLQGMYACVEKKFKQKNVKGLTVCVQGLGHVGIRLVELLKQEGAQVIGCDINPENVKLAKQKFHIDIVDPKEIFKVKCDVFAPCALGGVLNLKTISELSCSIVAGAANNQLLHESDGMLLEKRGILYAPDYLINAGGLINVSLELEGYSEERAKALTRNIYTHLKEVFKISEQQKIPPHLASNHLAEERLQKVAQIPRDHSLDKSKIRRELFSEKKKVA